MATRIRIFAVVLLMAASCGRYGFEAEGDSIMDGGKPGSSDGATTPDANIALCAMTCQGECVEDLCVLDCSVAGLCDDPEDGAQCPPNLPCQVLCDEPGECDQGVDCDDASSCDIRCTGAGSCSGDVNCGGESCTIVCGSNACGELDCDAERCQIDCSADGACDDASCDESCACDLTCGPMSCGPGPVCAAGCSVAGSCSSEPDGCASC